MLCADGPVATLVGLSLAPEHRRGHGALYDGLCCGRVGIGRLRWALACLPLPRWPDGRITLGGRCQHRGCGRTPPPARSRLFCHVYGRGKGQAQMIPGWPYSVVAALEPGRTSWTAVLDAVRLGPADDETEVTAAQVREVVDRLIAAGQWQPGDPDILIVFDAGYDVTRLAHLLTGLPVGAGRAAALGPGAVLPGAAPRAAAAAARSGTARSSPWRTRRPGPARRSPPHRHRPVRHRRRRRVGPAAPAADPPRRLARTTTANCPSSTAR